MEKYINVFPDKSNVEYDRIYHFTNGENFKFLNSNREINMPHANKIARAIIEENQAQYIDAISVDINTYIVIDGQHRLTAFKKAWEKGLNVEMDVRFKDYPKDMLHIIIDMNTNHKNWTTNDRVNSLREKGNSIDKLIEFCNDDKHSLLHRLNKKGLKTPTLRYASALMLGKSITQDIKDNKVRIKDSQFEFGHKLHGEAEAILDALQLKTRTGGWLEHFLTAWHNVRCDGMYNETINKLGFDKIVGQIGDYVDRTTDGSTKEWEERLKSAIYQIRRYGS